MTGIHPTEKFIAYIDILGYSALTRAAEAGNGFSFEDLDQILRLLGSEADRHRYRKYGPTTCPQAPLLQRDLDFRITQAWDSVVVSVEISPAGVINLVSHCFGACTNLLIKGVMCRGYIKRGLIFHDGDKIFGSGHVDTVAKERNVSFFKREANERGTPFIEIDPDVVNYIANQGNECVKKWFGRMVLSHDSVTAIFPFKRFRHSIAFGDFGDCFDPEQEKMKNNIVRDGLKQLKLKVFAFADQSDASVMRKTDHYLRAIDEQLIICDRTDERVDKLTQPIGRPVQLR